MLTTSTFERSPVPSGEPSHVWHALAAKMMRTCLVDRPPATDAQELLTYIRGLPLDTQLLWQDLVRKRFGTVRAPVADCGHKVELTVVLSDQVAGSCAACGGSVAGIGSALAHPIIQQTEGRQLRGLKSGDACESVLRSAFEPIAGFATHSIVIDRFAVTDALRAEQSSRGSSGLLRFVRLCAERGIDEIDIVASTEGKVESHKPTPAELTERLSSTLASARTGQTRVTLHVVRDSPARRKMHDRWLGFSWSGSGQISWSLGKGLGQFSGVRSRQAHSISLVADDTVATIRAQVRSDIVVSALVA